MQQVQILIQGHIGHLRCERQSVRRVLEEWIVQHFDFVKMDALARVIQLDRHSITDEMNLVASRRELFPNFCRHDAAAPIRWDSK